MNVIEVNMYQAAGLAVLMLVIGRMLVARIEFLRKYCIPAPVVGGLIFAILHVILRSMGILEFRRLHGRFQRAEEGRYRRC